MLSSTIRRVIASWCKLLKTLLKARTCKNSFPTEKETHREDQYAEIANERKRKMIGGTGVEPSFYFGGVFCGCLLYPESWQFLKIGPRGEFLYSFKKQ